MILHIGSGGVDGAYPAVALCGKIKERQSLVNLPFACVKCVNIIIDSNGGVLQK